MRTCLHRLLIVSFAFASLLTPSAILLTPARAAQAQFAGSAQTDTADISASQPSPQNISMLYIPVVATPATTQELIEIARASGRIDYGTSLLYRAYAFFGDDRLPDEFWGAASETHEPRLIFEIKNPEQPVSPQIQAQLQAFIVRPSDPTSAYSMAENKTTASALATSICPKGWVGEPSAQYAVTVWAACTPGVKASERAAQLVSQVALVEIDKLWGPQKDFMGEPLIDDGPDPGGKDTGNNDSNIDIYLVPPSIKRAGKTRSIPNDAFAVTIPALPNSQLSGLTGVESSAFILMPRATITSKLWRSRFAHELFHAQQFRYNVLLSGGSGRTFWFDEASATWAEQHFVNDTAKDLVHLPFFVNGFQHNTTLPLHMSFKTTDKRAPYMYTAYIWPFFMEQEAKTPAIIANTWKALNSVKDGNANKANDVIDTMLPFATNFHKFAVRNLNTVFYSGDGEENPLKTRYIDLDNTFPDKAPPVFTFDEVLKVSETAKTFTDTLPSLKAHYYHYVVEENYAVSQVKFDFSQLSPSADLDIDAVVKIVGKPWELRSFGGNRVITFCLLKPGENIDEIYFIVSNHNKNLASTIKGTFTAQASTAPCCSSTTGMPANGSQKVTSADISNSCVYMLTWNRSARIKDVFDNGSDHYESESYTVRQGDAIIRIEGTLESPYYPKITVYSMNMTVTSDELYNSSINGGACGTHRTSHIIDPNRSNLRIDNIRVYEDLPYFHTDGLQYWPYNILSQVDWPVNNSITQQIPDFTVAWRSEEHYCDGHNEVHEGSLKTSADINNALSPPYMFAGNNYLQGNAIGTSFAWNAQYTGTLNGRTTTYTEDWKLTRSCPAALMLVQANQPVSAEVLQNTCG